MPQDVTALADARGHACDNVGDIALARDGDILFLPSANSPDTIFDVFVAVRGRLPVGLFQQPVELEKIRAEFDITSLRASPSLVPCNAQARAGFRVSRAELVCCLAGIRELTPIQQAAVRAVTSPHSWTVLLAYADPQRSDIRSTEFGNRIDVFSALLLAQALDVPVLVDVCLGEISEKCPELVFQSPETSIASTSSDRQDWQFSVSTALSLLEPVHQATLSRLIVETEKGRHALQEVSLGLGLEMSELEEFGLADGVTMQSLVDCSPPRGTHTVPDIRHQEATHDMFALHDLSKNHRVVHSSLSDECGCDARESDREASQTRPTIEMQSCNEVTDDQGVCRSDKVSPEGSANNNALGIEDYIPTVCSDTSTAHLPEDVKPSLASANVIEWVGHWLSAHPKPLARSHSATRRQEERRRQLLRHRDASGSPRDPRVAMLVATVAQPPVDKGAMHIFTMPRVASQVDDNDCSKVTREETALLSRIAATELSLMELTCPAEDLPVGVYKELCSLHRGASGAITRERGGSGSRGDSMQGGGAEGVHDATNSPPSAEESFGSLQRFMQLLEDDIASSHCRVSAPQIATSRNASQKVDGGVHRGGLRDINSSDPPAMLRAQRRAVEHRRKSAEAERAAVAAQRKARYGQRDARLQRFVENQSSAYRGDGGDASGASRGARVGVCGVSTSQGHLGHRTRLLGAGYPSGLFSSEDEGGGCGKNADVLRESRERMPPMPQPMPVQCIG
eukprot:TRINITY_DN34971_c0_g1_i1.p1 TRINITY_DN34971_c0_g1~~TRINITY_DN34971_c0_g1_i1.p1  ORF type:complete len:739 (-),score=116.10 TRINITY_DN34971_c0_g1_i1:70-2286(-)